MYYECDQSGQAGGQTELHRPWKWVFEANLTSDDVSAKVIQDVA